MGVGLLKVVVSIFFIPLGQRTDITIVSPAPFYTRLTPHTPLKRQLTATPYSAKPRLRSDPAGFPDLEVSLAKLKLTQVSIVRFPTQWTWWDEISFIRIFLFLGYVYYATALLTWWDGMVWSTLVDQLGIDLAILYIIVGRPQTGAGPVGGYLSTPHVLSLLQCTSVEKGFSVSPGMQRVIYVRILYYRVYPPHGSFPKPSNLPWFCSLSTWVFANPIWLCETAILHSKRARPGWSLLPHPIRNYYCWAHIGVALRLLGFGKPRSRSSIYIGKSTPVPLIQRTTPSNTWRRLGAHLEEELQTQGIMHPNP